MLENLEFRFTSVRDAADLPPIIRIAAQAALEVIGKYYARTDDNEVYRISMGMSLNLHEHFLFLFVAV